MPADTRVGAALAVATPDLLAALTRTRPDDPGAERLGGKLRRYLIRMKTRPTPYGLFAGVGLVEFGAVTDLRLGAGEPRTRTRPDMGWLADLVGALESDIAVRRRLRFFANPSVLVRAGHVFLAEAAPHGTGRPGEPVTLRATGVVRRVLELARTPIPHDQLVAELLSASGATVEKVEALIAELWKHTVLLSDLRPPLTCPDPAQHIRRRLAEVPAAGPAMDGLERLRASLERWDALPLGDRLAAWPDLVEQVGAVHPLRRSPSPLQVDMALALEGRQVHAAVAQAAASAGELLLRLSPCPRGLPHIEAYRRAFEARYGPDREVALLELLDPYFGLGPPSPGKGGAGPDGPARRDRELRRLALRAQRDRRLVVELDDRLLERLETWSPGGGDGAPVSLDVSVFAVARSAAALDAGDFQVVVGPNVGAEAAGRGTGRFGELLGGEGVAALSRAASAEAARMPDRCWSEVVYPPRHARSANVAVRPAIRAYEIVVGATPGVPWERVIPLDELVVGVREGRLRVRWPAMGTEVAVAAGHMLDVTRAPDVVRFLFEAAGDGRAQLSPFDWGSARTFPFLPRVQRGRVVLSLARWRVETGDHPEALPADRLEAFGAGLDDWRSGWSVPRHVYLAAADHRLLLDLEDPDCVGLLREEVRRLPPDADLVLQEALPGPAEAWLPGCFGHHIVELVVPVVLRPRPGRAGGNARRPAVGSSRRPAVTTASRLRAPGSDWLYLKLYGPTPLEDELIADPVRSFAGFALSSGLADAWFFVRYADPDPHLRIRFHGDPSALVGPLLGELCRWAGELVAEGSCLRFGFETYDREIERYGGPRGMLLSEAVFAADSVAVSELLRVEPGSAPARDRLTLAIVTIDDLLGALGLSEEERLAWYRRHAPLAAEDGRDYRERQAGLRRLLGRAGGPGGLGAGVEQILADRRAALERIVAELAAAERAGALDLPVAGICRSYVHLHCNRLCGPATPTEARALALLRRTREALDRGAPTPV
jgi:thiopeptide-type bacteriocin biosynthesis protein